MIQKFDDIKREIASLQASKEYADSNKKCYELIEELLFSSGNINDDLWFCFYMISYNYYLLKEYNSAIENGKYASFIIRNYNLVNFNKTVLLLANCYRDKGCHSDAIKMYKHCAHYYKMAKNKISRAQCLYNIARILNMIGISETIKSVFLSEEFCDRRDRL